MPTSTDAASVAVRLRESIAAERKRLERRPVPTEPWVMPLSLDDLDVLLTEHQEAILALREIDAELSPPSADRAERAKKIARTALAKKPGGGMSRGGRCPVVEVPR